MFFVYLLVFPMIVLVFLFRQPYEKLTDDNFQERFGALFKDLVLKKRSTLAYTTVFLVRRLVLALAIAFMKGAPLA
jgi:hypothetical protein